MNSQQLQSFTIPGSGYGYTGANIESLTSFENTLAVGLLDESGSTNSFAAEMEACVKEIIKSLRYSPRPDNLIYRHTHFGSEFREHHGFLPLQQINESMYDGCYKSGGRTTLYDSCDRVIRELKDYSEKQWAQRYLCNGIIYIITDGVDYGSSLKEKDVRTALADSISSESLESLVTVLIGINNEKSIQDGLEAFQKNVGFTRYIPVGSADAKSLAQITNFISQAISSQSQALGSGGPSQAIQSLTF